MERRFFYDRQDFCLQIITCDEIIKNRRPIFDACQLHAFNRKRAQWCVVLFESNFPDKIVTVISYVYITGSINGYAGRPAKLCRCSYAIRVPGR